jgi:hypothetical protein
MGSQIVPNLKMHNGDKWHPTELKTRVDIRSFLSCLRAYHSYIIFKTSANPSRQSYKLLSPRADLQNESCAFADKFLLLEFMSETNIHKSQVTQFHDLLIQVKVVQHATEFRNV